MKYSCCRNVRLWRQLGDLATGKTIWPSFLKPFFKNCVGEKEEEGFKPLCKKWFSSVAFRIRQEQLKKITKKSYEDSTHTGRRHHWLETDAVPFDYPLIWSASRLGSESCLVCLVFLLALLLLLRKVPGEGLMFYMNKTTIIHMNTQQLLENGTNDIV